MRWWRDHSKNTRREHELDCEIAFHLEELIEVHRAKGLEPEEAKRQAILEFGGHEQIKQRLRETHSCALFETLRFYLRTATRFIRRSPAFSILVILILGVGIGANSAVFSAMDAVIFEPLPYPHDSELLRLYQHDLSHHDANTFVAPVRLEDWNRMNSTFQNISGYYIDNMTETSSSLPERVAVAFVAPRFLSVMGVAPLIGRDFSQQETHYGGPTAVLISYRFWQSFYDGNPAAVSKKLHVGGFSFSIIGVMPKSFSFPASGVDL